MGNIYAGIDLGTDTIKIIVAEKKMINFLCLLQ